MARKVKSYDIPARSERGAVCSVCGVAILRDGYYVKRGGKVICAACYDPEQAPDGIKPVRCKALEATNG